MDWKIWNKNKKTDVIESSVNTNSTNTESCLCHAKYSNLDIRRSVLDWRDQQIENVELHLIRELPRLYNALDEQIDKMSKRELLYTGAFSKKYLEPIYKDWVEQEVGFLVEAAQNELLAVFTHVLEIREQGNALNHDEKAIHYSDAAFSAAATAAGLAGIPAVLSGSIVSAGGIAGLLGATVISWPVAVIGSVLILASLVVSYKQLGRIRSRAISRYKKKVRNAIGEQVLGVDSEKDSILQRLQVKLNKTAEDIILEIDKC